MKQSKTLIAVIAVITMFSIAKAEGPIMDFDMASSESRHFTDYISEQAISMRNMPTPTPSLSCTRDTMDNTSKLRELDSHGRIAFIKLLNSSKHNPLNNIVAQLANSKDVVILHSHQGVVFVEMANGSDYKIILRSADPELINAIAESSLQVKPATQTKYVGWLVRCRDVIDWIIRIVNGAEIATRVVTKVCENEWVEDGTPTTPAHIPFNPSHVRNHK